jgi:hypothetical protein
MYPAKLLLQFENLQVLLIMLSERRIDPGTENSEASLAPLEMVGCPVNFSLVVLVILPDTLVPGLEGFAL